MNFLRDARLCVADDAGEISYLSIGDILCSQKRYHLRYPLEVTQFAATQMLICLAQVLCPPKTQDERKKRVGHPISRKIWDAAVAQYEGYFEIDGPAPFLQTPLVLEKDKEATRHPIQKLFSVAFDSHLLSQKIGMVDQVCPTCALIQLFSWHTNGPSVQGNQPRLRGRLTKGTYSAVLAASVYLYADNVRDMTLLNMLPVEDTDRLYAGKENEPAWMPGKHWSEKPQVAESIGLFRGLFWPAVPVLYYWVAGTRCDCCGAASPIVTKEYVWRLTNVQGLNCQLKGLWRHPHSFYSTYGEDKKACDFNGRTPPIESLGAWLGVPRVSDDPVQEDPKKQSKITVEYQKPYLLDERFLIEGYTDAIVGGLIARKKPVNVGDALFERYPIASPSSNFVPVISVWTQCKTYLQRALSLLGGKRCLNLDNKKTKPIEQAGLAEFYREAQPWTDEALASDGIDTRPMRSLCIRIYDDTLNRYSVAPEKMGIAVRIRISLAANMKKIGEQYDL
jgi:hypothetical protein